MYARFISCCCFFCARARCRQTASTLCATGNDSGCGQHSHRESQRWIAVCTTNQGETFEDCSSPLWTHFDFAFSVLCSLRVIFNNNWCTEYMGERKMLNERDSASVQCVWLCPGPTKWIVDGCGQRLTLCRCEYTTKKSTKHDRDRTIKHTCVVRGKRAFRIVKLVHV